MTVRAIEAVPCVFGKRRNLFRRPGDVLSLMDEASADDVKGRDCVLM